MNMTDHAFSAKLDALGENATEEQGRQLTCWIVKNYPPCAWGWCRAQAVNVPGVYYSLGERMAESGE